jgi:hypothetical protein
MKARIRQLAERVDKVIALANQLKAANEELKSENAKLKSELSEVKKELREFKLGHSDKAEAVRSRLTSVLSRLEELETLRE